MYTHSQYSRTPILSLVIHTDGKHTFVYKVSNIPLCGSNVLPNCVHKRRIHIHSRMPAPGGANAIVRSALKKTKVIVSISIDQFFTLCVSISIYQFFLLRVYTSSIAGFYYLRHKITSTIPSDLMEGETDYVEIVINRRVTV